MNAAELKSHIETKLSPVDTRALFLMKARLIVANRIDEIDRLMFSNIVNKRGLGEMKAINIRILEAMEEGCDS